MEDDLKLSAYSDGELPDAERRLIESSLHQNPAQRETLDVYGRLRESAILEAVPEATAGEQRIFPALERALENPDAATRRIYELAAAEPSPPISDSRFGLIWHNIAVHKVAAKEACPAIAAERWDGVWHKISGRTSTRNKAIAPPPQKHSTWIWSIGAGLAASIVLALAMPKPAIAPAPLQQGDAVAVEPMIIPEPQDEQYGVRVRLDEAGSDPIVTLYFKNPSPDDMIDSSDSELK